MKREAKEKQITRFLLGDLSEEERLEIEERFFRDDEFYVEARAIEEELIDDYVRGEMSGGDRRRFEAHYLASQKRRKKVEFAVSLARALPEARAGKIKAASWRQLLLPHVRPLAFAFRFAMAMAVFVALAGLMWLAIENRQMSKQFEQARSERDLYKDQLQSDEAEYERKVKKLEDQIAALGERGNEMDSKLQEKLAELERLKRQRVEPSQQAVAFALLPGINPRGGNDEPEKLVIPRATALVRLQLGLEAGEIYQSYLAELRTAGGNTVWSQDMLMARPTSYGQSVSLNLPASHLLPGEYELTLRGAVRGGPIEDVAYYYFNVIKR